MVSKAQFLSFAKSEYTSFFEFEEAINELKADIKSFINKELENEIYKVAKLFCFSCKYSQWIPGIFLSKEIKKRYPSIKVVIGGLDSKKEAYELMNVWDCFDFAIFGEGEIPLLKLYQNLNYPDRYAEIPQLVYRVNSEVFLNNNKSRINFNNFIYPNYDDYFSQIKGFKYTSDFMVRIPVNAIRGCNWNTCKFCTSKNGYVYNERTPDSIVGEIEYMINKYDKYEFVFVDNSSYKEIKNLELLTEMLINLMNRTGKILRIELTLNHVGIDKKLINKMYIAGVRRIQIGFESFSDKLLKLMNKENSFADNLLFMKFALQYDIYFPLIIIRNIPEETMFDVIESSNNLHFFRFYLQNKSFDFQYSQMSILIDSIYSRKLTDENLLEYNYYETENFLPESFSKTIDKSKLLFFSYMKEFLDNKQDWHLFHKEFLNYKNNNYDYKIIIDNGSLYYYEFYNGQPIVTLIFDEPVYLDILKFTDSRICSIDYLYTELSRKNQKQTMEELMEIINRLKSKYLLYANANYSEIISTILIEKCA